MRRPVWHGPTQCASYVNMFGFPRAHRCRRTTGHRGQHRCDGIECDWKWTSARAEGNDPKAGHGDRIWSQFARFRPVWVAVRLEARRQSRRAKR